MRLSVVLMSALLLGLLSACTNVTYQQMQTSAAELSALDSFRWENTSTSTDDTERAFYRAFEDSFAAQLHNKGYRTANEGETADFRVDYRISVVPQTLNQDALPGTSQQWELDETGEPVYTTGNQAAPINQLIQQGLLILTLTRNSDNSIVWQAGVSGKIDDNENMASFYSLAEHFAQRLGKELPRADNTAQSGLTRPRAD